MALFIFYSISYNNNEVNHINSITKKKQRIKISDINSFKQEVKKEGHNINEYDDEKFNIEVAKIFSKDMSIINKLYECISENNITYRANNIKDLFDYIEKIILFEKQHYLLCEKISKVSNLIIDRVEYEREQSYEENIENIMIDVQEIANHISEVMNEEEKIELNEIEKELDNDYIYTKDIELLKKMVINESKKLKEMYNEKTKIKTISIKIPKVIGFGYIKAKKSTVEYHEYLSNNIPRMQRLINNLDNYIKEDEKGIFTINQSETLQDSINIVVAKYNDKVFRAISGSNEIDNYCMSPSIDEAIFKSRKVNKLGKLGVGYNRVNDSEKKILEEIHKQINNKSLKDTGKLVLYSKWEPCPSCYLVIKQFCEKYPNIVVKVKYMRRYGQK